MTASLQEYLSGMKPEHYEMLVGTGHEDALRYGFGKKRAVHPGVNGKVVPPPMAPMKWLQLMDEEANRAKKRMAYIHVPFCSHICLYCGFFRGFGHDCG